MSEREREGERAAGQGGRSFAATVDSAEGEVVVLDVEGHRLKLPRALFVGEVREGEGYTLTLAPAPGVAEATGRSVQERLQALQGASPGGLPRDLGMMPGAPPRDLGAMPGAGEKGEKGKPRG